MNEGSVRQAIVPAAGWGTRLLPLSYAIPKELLPVGPKPALQWIAEELAASGIEHIVLVANPEKLPIDGLFRVQPELVDRLRKDHKDDRLRSLWPFGPHADVQVSVAIQAEQLGLGHAVACGRSLLAEGPVAIALGDSLIGPPGNTRLMQRLIDVFHERDAAATIAFERVPRDQVSAYGIADPGPSSDGVFELRDIVEKPTAASAPSEWAVAARYVFRSEIFAAIDQTARGAGGEFQLTDAIRWLLANGRRVIGVELANDEKRFDLGSFENYWRAVLSFNQVRLATGRASVRS